LKKEKNAFHNFFGFATQECSFYEHLSVQDNLFFYGSLYNLSRTEVKKIGLK